MIKFWFDKFRYGRASHRIRAHIPCEAMKSMGYDSAIVRDTNSLTDEDIVIFTKDSNIENMRTVKSKGYKVGFDLCDNKFDEKPIYYDYCKEVDFITVNSETMKEVVKTNTGRDSFYYTDCVDRKIASPQNKTPSNPIKLVWYGSSASNKYVDWVAVIKNLESAKINYTITICVDRAEYLRGKFLRNLKGLDVDPNKFIHKDWTWELQQQLVEEADIVFIPILGADGRRTITKSHNRVVDGIAQGKWVISSPVPSYNVLNNFCWLKDPAEGIKYYINNIEQVNEKILLGQKWIKENVSPEAVAEQLIKIHNEVKK